MYGFKCGLKTGLYYLRQKPVVDQIKFQYEIEKKQEEQLLEEPIIDKKKRCKEQNEDGCVMCQ